MRLTCPNCSAEYEVDAALIPDEGRDVQCSNCGKTWFELPPTAVADAPAPAVSAPVADAIRNAPEDEGDPSDWDDGDESASDEARDATADQAPRREAETADEPSEVERAEPPKRREVDPRALDILKEEADRELATRRKEREGVEVQSEFDLSEESDGSEPSRALRARMARLRGESDPRPHRAQTRQSEASGYKRPERELLPDIDEINSSLRPPDSDAGAAEAARRSEFRRGFGFMIGLSAFLVAVYIAAPAIARSVPAMQPVMAAYLDAANNFRDLIDSFIR